MNNVELLDLEESTIMSIMFINGRSLMVKCCHYETKLKEYGVEGETNI
jgi:hypothetical protein